MAKRQYQPGQNPTATQRPGFMLYFRDLDAMVDELDNESLGMMLRAMYHYALNGEEPMLNDRVLRVYWHYIKDAIDRDAESYTDTCVSNTRRAYAASWKKYAEKNGIDPDNPALKDAWIDEQIAIRNRN